MLLPLAIYQQSDYCSETILRMHLHLGGLRKYGPSSLFLKVLQLAPGACIIEIDLHPLLGFTVSSFCKGEKVEGLDNEPTDSHKR